MPERCRYVGALYFGSARSRDNARAAFEGALGGGLLAPWDVDWGAREARIDCERAGDSSHRAADQGALIRLAKPARRGAVDIEVIAHDLALRVMAKGKVRAIRPDRPPAEAPHPLARPRHPARVEVAAAAGDRLAFGGGVTGRRCADADVTVWDITAGRQIHRLAGLKEGITALAFSRDGAWLAAGDRGGRLRLWEIATGRRRGRKLGRGAVRSLDFSPDGARIAAALPRAGIFVSTLDLKPAAARWPIRGRQAQAVRWLDDGDLLFQQADRCRVITPEGEPVPAAGTLTAAAGPRALRARGDRALSVYRTHLVSWRVGHPARAEVLRAAHPLWRGAFLDARLSAGGRVAFVTASGAGWWDPETDRRAVVALARPARCGLVTVGALAGLGEHGVVAVVAPDALPPVAPPPPPTPADRRAAAWRERVAAWEAEGLLPVERHRQEWSWGYTETSHEGVNTYLGELHWYLHPNNPHSGSDGARQSYAGFLVDGPWSGDMPEPQLRELYAAVKLLAQG